MNYLATDDGSDSGDESLEVNVRSSDFFVTLNTHRQYSDELRDALLTAISDLGTAEFAQRALFDGSGTELVTSTVRPSEIGIEIGRRAGLAHAHFIIEFEHSTAARGISLVGRGAEDGLGINERFQRYFSAELGIDGCYVRASLLGAQSAAKNYNRKSAQASERHLRSVILPSVRPITD